MRRNALSTIQDFVLFVNRFLQLFYSLQNQFKGSALIEILHEKKQSHVSFNTLALIVPVIKLFMVSFYF